MMSKSLMLLSLSIVLLSIAVVRCGAGPTWRGATESRFDAGDCRLLLDNQTRLAIHSKVGDVRKIIDHLLNGSGSGVTYNEVAKFVDRFDKRMTGTDVLENAIDYMVQLLKKEGHDNVHTEEAPVPKWTRGNEWAFLMSPRKRKLTILGLGGSTGTQIPIIAPVMVVRNFAELRHRWEEAHNKIVVYNFDYRRYGDQVQYRTMGATEAARLGAVAVLVKSVTPFSINSPHTGIMYYDSSYKKIPAASLTVEDAEMIQRMALRGENITVQLYMEAENHNFTTSRNTISEVTGSHHPEQVVIVSGHLDSWDVGQGAMDDAGGAFVSWRALSVLKKLGLVPKRTIRSILWTAEEQGLYGARQYLSDHFNELSNISLVMESDAGTFTPRGLAFSGRNQTAKCIVQEALNLLRSLDADRLVLTNIVGSDISAFERKGVPGAGLLNDNDRYFYFHHADGDSMSVLDPRQLDQCTAVWASMAYVFASIDGLLPR